MSGELDLIYVPESFPQVSETFVVDEIRGLRSRGHSVSIVPRIPGSPEAWQDPRSRALRECAVDVSRSPVCLGALPIALRRGGQVWPGKRPEALGRHARSALEIARLVGRIRRRPADAIVCHFGFDNAVASAIAGKQMRVPVVLWLHGSDIYGQPHRSLGWISGNVSQIVTNSVYSRDLIHSLRVEAPVAVSHLGVDLDVFSPEGPERKEEAPTVVSVGRLGHNKNHERLLRIFALALEAVPNAVLWLVGSGPDREKLEHLAQELSIAGSVRFEGWKGASEVAALMRRAWIFALLSDKEGLGVAFLEAQACGLPCLGAAVGGVPEAVAEGLSGFLVDFRRTGSEAGAARRIVELLSRPDLRAQMGQAGVRAARDRFDGSRHVDTMDGLLRALSSPDASAGGAAGRLETGLE